MRNEDAGAHADEAARLLASELDRRGLTGPARILAEAHRPLAPLLSDAGVALGGLMGAIDGGGLGGLRALIADPHALERLTAHLDRVERGSNDEPR